MSNSKFLQRMMSPATALMGGVSMTFKFVFVGLIVFFSLLIGTASLYTALSKTINNTHKELSGLELLNTTTRATQLLQQQRGVSTALMHGLHTPDLLLFDAQESCNETIQQVENLLPDDVELRSVFKKIKAQWDVLQQPTEGGKPRAQMSPAMNFQAYTDLIKQLMRFHIQLADYYALTLDPDLDTYYLVEMGFKNLPAYLEHLGHLRGIGTSVLLNHRLNLTDKSILESRLAQAHDVASDVRENLYKLGGSNPVFREHAAISAHRIEQLTRQIDDLVEADLLQGKFSLRPATYFKILTVTIDQAYVELIETYSAELKSLLEKRLEHQTTLLAFNFAGTAISLLLALYFAVGTFMVVTRTTNEIIEAANTFSAGNLRRRVHISTNDELGAIGESFNRMAADLAGLYQKLEAAERRASNIIETALDAVVQINGEGEIIAWNHQAELIFGWTQAEVLGHMIHDKIVPLQYRDAHREGMRRFLETGHGPVLGRRIEIVALHRDGHEFPIELAITPNQINGEHEFSAFIRDITELKKTQAELHDALKRAELANGAKSSFLANMSHEIRTPINAVLGYSLIAQRREMSDNVREFFQKIHTAGQGLLGVINDVLDFSKIEAGKLEMEMIPFEPEVIISNVADLFSPKAREKGVELVMGVMPGVPTQLIGDPVRLAQVLTNLIGNAVKFTPQGEVTLVVETVVKDEKQAVLNFVVKDTGIGMNEQQLSTIFRPFVQADSSTTRNFGGTGLGLVICQQIVKMMGGEISVASAEGQGSQFQFSVGFALPSDARGNLSLFTGKRLLIVDDNALMRRLLAKTAESFGAVVQEVETGEEALDVLNSGIRPDCVFMDLHLPGINGLETIRQMKVLDATIPAVLITAEEKDLIGDEANSLCQKVVSKPVSRSKLHEALLSIFSGRSLPKAVGKLPNAVPNLLGRRILLVDDNEFNREIGCDLLALTGATIDTAVDGEKAVQALVQQSYDLVFMDVQMPVMDGYEAVKLIRGQGMSVPIVGLTAHAMAEDRVKVLNSGMNDFLSKPIVTESLYAILTKWLGEAEGQQSVTQPMVESAVFALDLKGNSATAHSFENLTGFDAVAAIERLGGNADKYKRYLEKFLKHNSNNLSDIVDALSAGDVLKAKRLSHSLKGIAGTLGAVDLQVAAGGVEKALSVPDIDSTAFLATHEMDDLRQQWGITIAELRMLFDSNI